MKTQRKQQDLHVSGDEVVNLDQIKLKHYGILLCWKHYDLGITFEGRNFRETTAKVKKQSLLLQVNAP